MSKLKIGLCSLLCLGQINFSFAADNATPEAASGRQTKSVVTAQKMMVVTANPYATNAGFAILKQGGSAIDAAIAVQLVLGLTEPQSSGLGGGGYLLHWDGQALTAWDGRETAPSSASETDFLDRPSVTVRAIRYHLINPQLACYVISIQPHNTCESLFLSAHRAAFYLYE